MITVTKKMLTDKTNLGAFTSRSKEFKLVVSNLEKYEKDTTNQNKLFLLKCSLIAWQDKKKGEFKKRDDKSEGLVRRLCVEAGIDDLRPPPAHTIKLIGDCRVSVKTESTLYNPDKSHPNEGITGGKAAPKVQRLDKNISFVLQEMQLDEEPSKPAVIIVDLYGGDLKSQGLEKVCDGKKIAEHIDDLLSATEGVPVIVCAKGRTLQTGGPLGGTYTSGHSKEDAIQERFRSKIAGKIEHFAFSRTNCVLVESGILEVLTKNRITDVFVVGFDANMCVAATIFGSEFGTDKGRKYYPGLLDFGFNVISSRFVVGSGNSPLKGSEGWPYMGPHNNV